MRPDPDPDALGPDLTAFEGRLSALRPPAAAIDRDRMLYEAGRADGRVSARPWRFAAGILLIATTGLAVTLADERSHRRNLEIALAGRVVAPRPALPAPMPPEAIEPPSPSSYLAMTARIVAGAEVPPPSEPRESAPAPQGGPSPSSPLRPHDLRRVLDL